MSLLLNGDCLEMMKMVESNSVDFIFCDLPYGQTCCKWDIIIPWEPFWKEIMRVKKIHTPIFMTTTTKFGVEIINSAPKKLKFFDLVWVKSASSGFLLSKKFPLRKHEMIYAFYEKLPFYDLSSHTHKFVNHKENTAEQSKTDTYGKIKRSPNGKAGSYEPPLPVSVVKEGDMVKDFTANKNGNIYDCPDNQEFKGRNGQPRYEPPLPVSVVKEWDGQLGEKELSEKAIYGKGLKENGYYKMRKKGEGTAYDPPLPVSVVKEAVKLETINSEIYGTDNRKNPLQSIGVVRYDPPLPNTMLEIKSTRGHHSTEKPVALIEWLLKYYSKEGDTVLDPTMGSGSSGVASKNMNRNYIGIEKDAEIYETAVNRIEKL